MLVWFIKELHVIWIIAVFFIGIFLLPANTLARTEIKPEITVAESFVENKTSNLNESGQITEITPGISINYTQARLDLTLGYRLNAFINSGLQAEDHESQSLNLDALINHIPNNWNTQVRAKVKQVNSSPDGIQVVNPINDSINTEELRIFGVVTSYQGQLKDDVDFLTQLSIDYADLETEEDTESIGVNINLNNYKTQRSLRWNVALNSRKFEPSQTAVSTISEDDNIDTLQAGLNYRINPKFSTFISANKSETKNENLNQTATLVGISWVPNTYSSIEVGAGNRGSDRNWSLDAVIRSRRLKFAANYDEGVTTSRSLIFEENTLQPGLVTTSQSLSITPVLLKKGTVTLTATGRRSELTFSYFNESRNQRDANSEEEKTDGVSLSATRKLSRLSSTRIYISRQDSESNQKNIIKDVELSYNRKMSQQVTLTAKIRSTDQASDIIQNEYEQNILGLSVMARF